MAKPGTRRMAPPQGPAQASGWVVQQDSPDVLRADTWRFGNLRTTKGIYWRWLVSMDMFLGPPGRAVHVVPWKVRLLSWW